MAYDTSDEALSLFSWLKIGSGIVNQDWGKFKYQSKYKKVPCKSLISLFLVWSMDMQALHRVYMLTFVHNADNDNANNHTQKGDW